MLVLAAGGATGCDEGLPGVSPLPCVRIGIFPIILGLVLPTVNSPNGPTGALMPTLVPGGTESGSIVKFGRGVNK